MDNRYPVQGSYILLPYGYKLKHEIFSKFKKTFENKLKAQTVEILIRIPQNFLNFHSSSEKLEESPNYQEQHFLVTLEDNKISSQPIFRGALDLGLYSLCKQTIRSFKNLLQTWLTQGTVRI